MPQLLVKPGRYLMAADPVCGTNGLAPCVGVAIYHGKWFIAHIESRATVKTRKDPVWARVATCTRNRLQQLLGPCGAQSVHVIGNFGDFSSIAIRDGIAAWVNGTVAITCDAWDGFEINANGTFRSLTYEENNTDGDGAFSIPANP